MVIKGKSVNRGGDFGIEVPCEYIFEGSDLSSRVSDCIGRIEEKFNAGSCLGIQNSSLIQCITATVNFTSRVQCFNEDAMTKVKNSVVRLCCYSYSDYCLKATGLKCFLRQAFVGLRL